MRDIYDGVLQMVRLADFIVVCHDVFYKEEICYNKSFKTFSDVNNEIGILTS